MSTTREEFLLRVRAAQRVAVREDGGAARAPFAAASGDDPHPLPALPVFDTPPGDRRERFCASLATMGGKHVALDSVQDLPGWFAERFPGHVPLSAAPEVPGAAPLDPARAPASLHEVEVGVVRARYGVAETGSVWLSEAEYGVNALGYLVQHLVVLLDPADLVDGLQDLYRLPDFHGARYAALVTGPSATADIEGVLIQGAQGVRSLTVVLLAKPA
ncbi:LutC/YkgG family protein [Burkholderia sp. 22PA0106]|uniref:LutC/YkgG family protein n=1 Tax=Burkholderia sp. 22PA0106 TaxID=3237371 RepID=UPI0039C4D2CB